jgi:FdrA protein
MVVETVIKQNVYYDSLVLMRLSADLKKRSGVQHVIVMMGTEENKKTVAFKNLLTVQVMSASANDLIAVIAADNEEMAKSAMDYCLNRLEVGIVEPVSESLTYRTLDAAIRNRPGANIVAISLPGRYAAHEARKALEAGLHVFLFTDNVAIDEEIQLKQLALERGLLMMGPDCGTAILHGKGLGFANSVREGAIGLVGASGTGMQEISTIINRLGSGISQAIGTGSRDVSKQVGGVTLVMGLNWLGRDPATHVIIIIAKPVGDTISEKMLALASRCRKPVVVYQSGFVQPQLSHENIFFAGTLEEAALLAVSLSGEKDPQALYSALYGEPCLADLVQCEHKQLNSRQKHFRGLFAGGTYANESAFLLLGAFTDVHGNISLPGTTPLSDPLRSIGHTCLDLGADFFTLGKPHPILDDTVRSQRLVEEATDPTVGAILIDLILGHGGQPDPAAHIAASIKMAKGIALDDGRHLPIIVNVCGVDEDPQKRYEQVERVLQSGAMVAPTNAAGTRLAIGILKGAPVNYSPPTVKIPLAAREERTQSNQFCFHLPGEVNVINIGLVEFFRALEDQGVPVAHVDFHPPAGGDERLTKLLSEML